MEWFFVQQGGLSFFDRFSVLYHNYSPFANIRIMDITATKYVANSSLLFFKYSICSSDRIVIVIDDSLIIIVGIINFLLNFLLTIFIVFHTLKLGLSLIHISRLMK